MPGAPDQRRMSDTARLGLLMSAIALVGSLSALLRPQTLDRALLPLVALAAGTLLGGALFHLIPAGVKNLGALHSGVWILLGFATFLALEQFLHWHHSHRASFVEKEPMTYLILLGDGLHNFLGGLAIGSTFLIDPKVGVTAWIAAATHEIPQELGDFGVLVHGGWPRRKAILWNFASGLTFLLGALLAYVASLQIDVTPLILFGAGNFIYIAASDLIPEIKSHRMLVNSVLHFGCFALGATALLALAYLFGPEP